MSLKEFQYKVEISGIARVYAEDRETADEEMEYAGVTVAGNKMISHEKDFFFLKERDFS